MIKEKLELINMSTEHLELVFNWRNENFIREVMFNSEVLKWENHMDWFHSIAQNKNKIYKILLYKNVPYGVANFHSTDLSTNIGEWGFYIGDKTAPKGMGKALAYMMLNFLFEEKKIRKVSAEVLDYNEISLKFHSKIGFKQDGILRKQIYKNDRFCDVYVYSIFIDEWIKTRELLEKELFN